MLDRAATSREARYRRLIRTMNAAIAAMEDVTAHDPIAETSTLTILRRQMSEYADYLAGATWWRAEK